MNGLTMRYYEPQDRSTESAPAKNGWSLHGACRVDIASIYLLALSARTLPIGTANAVWVGIGTFGTVVLGMAYLGEPANAGRVFFLILLMIAIIGLKLTAH